MASNVAPYSILLVIFMLIATLLNSMLNIGSPLSIFGLLNAIQLYLLLPLIGTYLPFDIVGFLAALNICLFSFSFLELSDIGEVNRTLNRFYYKQTTSYLDLLGLESSSAFLNLYTIVFIFVLLLGVTVLSWITLT